MNIKKIYFSKIGRVSRLHFFLYLLIVVFLFLSLNYAFGFFFSGFLKIAYNFFLGILLLFISLPLIYKRAHDIGYDGKRKAISFIISFFLTRIAFFMILSVNMGFLVYFVNNAEFDKQFDLETEKITTGQIEQMITSLSGSSESEIDFPLYTRTGDALTESDRTIVRTLSKMLLVNVFLYIILGGCGIWNLVLFLQLLFTKGMKGPNKYGPDPLETKKK